MIMAALSSVAAMNRRRKNKRGGELMKNEADATESCAVLVAIIETFLSVAKHTIYWIIVRMCCS